MLLAILLNPDFALMSLIGFVLDSSRSLSSDINYLCVFLLNATSLAKPHAIQLLQTELS